MRELELILPVFLAEEAPSGRPYSHTVRANGESSIFNGLYWGFFVRTPGSAASPQIFQGAVTAGLSVPLPDGTTSDINTLVYRFRGTQGDTLDIGLDPDTPANLFPDRAEITLDTQRWVTTGKNAYNNLAWSAFQNYNVRQTDGSTNRRPGRTPTVIGVLYWD